MASADDSDSDGDSASSTHVYHLYLSVTAPIRGLEWAGRGLPPAGEDDDLAPLWDALGDTGHIWDRSSNWVPARASVEAAIDWTSPGELTPVLAALRSCRVASLKVYSQAPPEPADALLSALLAHLPLDTRVLQLHVNLSLAAVFGLHSFLMTPPAQSIEYLALEGYAFSSLLQHDVRGLREANGALRRVCHEDRHVPRFLWPGPCLCHVGSRLGARITRTNFVRYLEDNAEGTEALRREVLRLLVAARVVLRGRPGGAAAPAHITRLPRELQLHILHLSAGLPRAQAARALEHAADGARFAAVARVMSTARRDGGVRAQASAWAEWLGNGGFWVGG
ncbi:hypothetical protein Q8F55_002966 [Vanrija albida]|uniref:F-box domain-containing protein n=1 Tax=Vanrija albida TaxID=181172 RepID=A0ABR3QBD5_9TREE